MGIRLLDLINPDYAARYGDRSVYNLVEGTSNLTNSLLKNAVVKDNAKLQENFLKFVQDNLTKDHSAVISSFNQLIADDVYLSANAKETLRSELEGRPLHTYLSRLFVFVHEETQNKPPKNELLNGTSDTVKHILAVEPADDQSLASKGHENDNVAVLATKSENGSNIPTFGRSNLSDIHSAPSIEPDFYAPVYDLSRLVDRKELLCDLDNRLTSASAPVYLYAIIGGLGKTEVAMAYCNSEYAQKYDYILWVAVTSEDVREAIVNQLSFLSSPNIEAADIDEAFRRFVIHAKKLSGDVLLVVDNITTARQIDSFDGEDTFSMLKWKVLATTCAVKVDKPFSQRVIRLDVLAEKHCEELFYMHYDELEENKNANREILYNRLFKALNYHTLLITLVAKIGNSRGYSVQELATFIEQQGIHHKKLQTKISADVHNKRMHDTADKIIGVLFDLTKLSDDEQRVLQYFSVLPNRPLPENILTDWMKSNQLTEDALAEVFRDLHVNGWLVLEKSQADKSITFMCHDLIQTAVRNKFGVDTNALEPLFTNMAVFFDMPIQGDDYTHLIAYFDCASAVCKCCPEITEALFYLKKKYVKILNHYDYSPDIAYELATQLRENYESVFPKAEEDEVWVTQKVNLDLIYAVAFANHISVRGKYMKMEQMRQDIFDYVKQHLPEVHIDYIRAERALALSKRNNGKLQEAMDDYSRLVSRVENIDIVASNPDSPDSMKWKYAYLLTLAGLAISYNAVANDTDDPEQKKQYLLSALEIRGKYLTIAQATYGETHFFLRQPYNDLGKTYLYLYDIDHRPEYLSEAEYYITQKYEMVTERFNENSRSFANALYALAMLLERKGDLKSALDIGIKALDTRKALLKDEWARVIMTSYRQVADLHHKLYCKNGELKDLDEALRCANKAVEIADYLYAGDQEKPIYRQCLSVLREIEQSIKDSKN